MIIGIDPGIAGAIVAIDEDGRYFSHTDMPVITVKKAVYDVDRIYHALDMLDKATIKDANISIFIEKTQPMYGMRVQASYGLGWCEGLFVGMIKAMQMSRKMAYSANITYELVRPQQWQKHFGITKAKGDKKAQSYLIAKQLFPTAELTGPRRGKKDGRSDALLTAEWGRRHRTIEEKE